jgi:hypothetical protein
MKRKQFIDAYYEPKRQRQQHIATVIKEFAERGEVDCFRECIAPWTLPPAQRLRWEKLLDGAYTLVDTIRDRVYITLDPRLGVASAFDENGRSRDFATESLRRPETDLAQLIAALRLILRERKLSLYDWPALGYVCRELRALFYDPVASPWITEFVEVQWGELLGPVLPPADMAFILFAPPYAHWSHEIYSKLSETFMSTWEGLEAVFLCFRYEYPSMHSLSHRFVSNIFTEEGLHVIKAGSPELRRPIYFWYCRRTDSFMQSENSKLSDSEVFKARPLERVRDILVSASKIKD